MPSPTDVLFRVHGSPVPTQIVLGDDGSIAIGADGLHRLFVEHGLERGAIVDGFPQAAAGRSDVDGQPAVLPHGCKRGHAPAHLGRSDVARAQAGDGVGVEFNFLRRESRPHTSAPANANRVSLTSRLRWAC